MDMSMGPKWHEMAMQGGGTSGGLMRHQVGVDCTCQSITAYSTYSLPMFGLGAMVIAAVSCLTTADIGLPPSH